VLGICKICHSFTEVTLTQVFENDDKMSLAYVCKKCTN